MAKVHRVSDDDGFGNWTYVSCGKPVRQDGQSWGVEATIDWTQVDCKSCLRTYIYPIGLRNTKGLRIQGDPSHEETMHAADLSTEAIVVHPWGPSSSAKVWPALCGSLSMATTTQGDKAHCTDCLAIMSERRKENTNMAEAAQTAEAPDWFRYVTCAACGTDEGQPADEQRWHFGSFSFQPDTETFTCNECGSAAQEDIADQNLE